MGSFPLLCQCRPLVSPDHSISPSGPILQCLPHPFACGGLGKRAAGRHLQIRIILIRQRHPRRVLHLLAVLIQQRLIDLRRRWREGNTSDKFEAWVPDELTSEPEEGFLEVVVGLGGDVVVLQVLLAVESDGLGFDFALFDVDFVAGEDDGDVFADADEVAYLRKKLGISL